MAIKLEISADLRQALQSLNKFSTEIDKAGGVTERMALQIAAALNLAASQFTKINNVKVNNPIELITKEVSDSVDSLVVSLGEASTGISSFNLTKVENPLENLPNQASVSLDELSSIFQNLQQNVSGLDFTTSIEGARLRLNATIDDIADKALGLNDAFGSIKGQDFLTLSSAFKDAEKSADQLEKEIQVLGRAFNETTDPVVLQRFSRQLSELQQQLSQKLTPKVSFEKISAPVINTPFVAPDVSGIKTFATESIRSLEGLHQELLRIGNELATATEKGTDDVGRLQLAFDELKGRITNIQASSLETAFVDTIKPVQQLENEITALQGAIKIGVNPNEIIKFSERLTVLQTQLANVKTGGVTIDTSKLSALQSAFIDTIKPVEQLEREIEALQQQLNKSTNPKAITTLQNQITKLSGQVNNVRFGGLENSLNRLGGVSANAANRIGQVPKSSSAATTALINFGRVAQDAPFGIIGIANNINPLIESLQRLQKESGSTGAAIKSLGASFLGGGGLGLAVSLITSAMTFFALQSNETNKAIDQHKERVDAAAERERAFQQALDQATSSVIQQADELTDLKSVFISVTKEVDNLTAATVRQGAAQFLFNSKNEAIQKLLNAQVQHFLRLRTGVNTAPEITFEGNENSLDPITKQIATAKDDIRKANELATGLEDLFNNIFQKTFGKGGGVDKAKEKFKFLFDFLPFDPNGKLKDDQRAELIDSIQKFQKEFRGILKGINFTGTESQVIEQALKFDIKLKTGKVEFDTKALSDSIHNSLRLEDLIPKSDLGELSKGATDLFIKTFQLESERIKDAKLFGDLTLLPTINQAIADAKIELARVGEELPRTFEGKDVFGNPIALTLDQLFDFTKISPADAIKAIQGAVTQIKDAATQMKEEIQNAFLSFDTAVLSDFGANIGQAIATGGNFLKTAAQQFASSMGSFVEQIGKILIKYGVIKTGIEKAIENFAVPGVTMIALGVAAVALGNLIKSSLGNVKGFNRGGIVPGQGNTDSVPALLTPGELVIPKDQVAKVQKLLKESVSFKLPTNIFGSLGLNETFNQIKKISSFQFNIPQLSIPTRNADVSSPLNKVSFALAGTAQRQIDVNVSGMWRGNDVVFGLNKVSQSQKRNYGRGGF